MWYKNKRALGVGCILLAAVFACIVSLWISHEPRIFKRYVCKPIPKSVRDLKVDHPWELSGHRYVMHFKISEEDLTLILRARRFKEVMRVKYLTGTLFWTVDSSHGEGLTLYCEHKGQVGPEWFRPDEWANPKCHESKERDTNYRRNI